MGSRASGSDAAVSEILGYILMFALSSVILVVSLQSFTASKDASESIVAKAEMQSVANRVAARLLEMSKVAEEFPNATYNITLRIPEAIGGEPYHVTAESTTVWVATSTNATAANSTTYNLGSVPGLQIGGTAYSGLGTIRIQYEKDALGRKYLNVTGGS